MTMTCENISLGFVRRRIPGLSSITKNTTRESPFKDSDQEGRNGSVRKI